MLHPGIRNSFLNSDHRLDSRMIIAEQTGRQCQGRWRDHDRKPGDEFAQTRKYGFQHVTAIVIQMADLLQRKKRKIFLLYRSLGQASSYSEDLGWAADDLLYSSSAFGISACSC